VMAYRALQILCHHGMHCGPLVSARITIHQCRLPFHTSGAGYTQILGGIGKGSFVALHRCRTQACVFT